MIDYFIFDSSTNKLRVDDHSILLVKEFADLWDQERNKCKEDPSGKDRLLAFKELTYIHLALSFKSPYFAYVEKEKHKAALLDSGLEESHLNNPEFAAAYNKYKEIRDSDPILSLIQTAYRTLYKTQVFLDSIDFNNDIDETGRPLYKPKDIIADIGSIRKMRADLQELEVEHKKNLAASSKVRGDATLGFQEA